MPVNTEKSLVTVKVNILEKEYQIKCGPAEKQNLIKAAMDVDSRMRIAKRGANINAEKAAVLTALNLANEIQEDQEDSEILESATNSIIDMNDRIDKILTKSKISSIVQDIG